MANWTGEQPACDKPGGCTSRRRCRQLGWCGYDRPTLEDEVRGAYAVDQVTGAAAAEAIGRFLRRDSSLPWLRIPEDVAA